MHRVSIQQRFLVTLLSILTFFPCFSFTNTMTITEKEMTYSLIMRLGYKSTPHLLYHQRQIRALGGQLDPVAPLQFFSFIVTHPDLKPALKRILAHYFTRHNFIDGAKEKLDAQKQSGLLFEELEGFCLYIHKDYQRLKSYCHTQEWDKWIDYVAE